MNMFLFVKANHFDKLKPKAEGGEAKIYEINNKLFKIYQDNSVQAVIKRDKKLARLMELKNQFPVNHRFGLPEQVVLTENRAKKVYPIGITMNKIIGEEISQVNDLDINTKYNLNIKNILEMILYMREDLHLLHSFKIVVGDLNERNYLFTDQRIPYMIDVDSWSLDDGLYPCEVIMPTYSDPLMKNGQFTKETDNFSFMVMAFKMLLRVHPYGGVHPKYKFKSPEERMKIHAHILEGKEKIKLPKNIRNFKMISDELLRKFRDFFNGDTRDIGSVFENFYSELAYCPNCKEFFWAGRNTCPSCNTQGQKIKTGFNPDRIFDKRTLSDQQKPQPQVQTTPKPIESDPVISKDNSNTPNIFKLKKSEKQLLNSQYYIAGNDTENILDLTNFDKQNKIFSDQNLLKELSNGTVQINKAKNFIYKTHLGTLIMYIDHKGDFVKDTKNLKIKNRPLEYDKVIKTETGIYYMDENCQILKREVNQGFPSDRKIFVPSIFTKIADWTGIKSQHSFYIVTAIQKNKSNVECIISDGNENSPKNILKTFSIEPSNKNKVIDSITVLRDRIYFSFCVLISYDDGSKMVSFYKLNGDLLFSDEDFHEINADFLDISDFAFRKNTLTYIIPSKSQIKRISFIQKNKIIEEFSVENGLLDQYSRLFIDDDHQIKIINKNSIYEFEGV